MKVFIVSFLLSFPFFLTASPFDLTFDTGYIDTSFSNRGIAQFNLALYDMTHFAYLSIDKSLIQDPMLSLMYRGLLTYFVIRRSHPGALYTIAYSSFGHSSRGAAFGYDVNYAITLDNGAEYETSSYYSFLSLLFRYNQTLLKSYTYYSGRISAHTSVDTSDWQLITSASGLNNAMSFSSLIENRFYHHQQTSVYDIIPYISSKLYLYYYANDESIHLYDSGGDLSKIQTYYDAKGLSITYDQVKSYSLYALLSSYTFHQLFYGWCRYLYGGPSTVYVQHHYHQFRIPDVNFYLTRYGPSYHIQSGYAYSSTIYIPFSVEFVFNGEFNHDITIGYERQWTDSLHSITTYRFGDGLGANVVIRRYLSPSIYMDFGWSLFDFRNLYGERQFLSLKNGHTSQEAWMAIGGRFFSY